MKSAKEILEECQEFTRSRLIALIQVGARGTVLYSFVGAISAVENALDSLDEFGSIEIEDDE